jgi:general stress protein 26
MGRQENRHGAKIGGAGALCYRGGRGGRAMVDRRQVLKVGVAAATWLMRPRRAPATAIPATTEEALRTKDLIYVATRRANGSLSEISPIWFMYDDGRIFFTTEPDSWKSKRIAAGSPLYIWVGAEDGPFVEGKAEATTDAALIDRMGAAYAEKYWIAWMGLFKPRSSRVADGKTNAYVVTLTQAEAPATK